MAPSSLEVGARPGAPAFLRELLAGRAPGSLPDADPVRGEVLRLLAAHRLLGLWLVEGERNGVPPSAADLTDEARALVTLQALRGALTLDAAERAGEALRRAGLEVLYFKGVGLLRCGVYRDVRARALGDADLLVRGGPLPDAVATLAEAGFEPWVPWRAGREAWLPAATFADRETPPELEISLDLHWRIPYGAFRSGDEGDGAWLWEGRHAAAGVPAPEAHALLVAEHVVRHLRVVPHLVGIADMVRLLPLLGDPAGLGDLAGARGSLRLLRTVLWFLRAELGVALDPALAEAVAVPSRVGALQAAALRLERLLGAGEARRQGRVRGLLGQALIQGSPRDLVRETLRVLHPPDAWLARRAGDGGAGGAARRRLGYSWELIRWASGRGPSPLSPNQEFEGPAGRR